MSSPITFSGFNNIDFNQVLNALMQQASAPLTALQDRQKALRSQITSFDTLGANVSSLRSAADALSSLSSLSTVSGTSSDNAVSVSTSTGAQAAHYDVVVNELARAQVTASTSDAPDADTTIIATGGTLTIGGVDVTVDEPVTLQGLADVINGTEGIGVSAAVIHTGSASYRLVLTSLETGAAHAFTVTPNLIGGTGITFGANAVDASDASVLVNNIPITSASNTLEDVVAGVTLTVSRQDADKVISVDVAPDATALGDKVEAFVAAYNNLVKFADAQRLSAGGGDAGSIGRDPILRSLRNGLRTELLAAHGSEIVTKLAEVGIEFTSTGTLQLNQTRFDEAISTDGDSVRALFAGTGGVFPAVEALLDDYSQSTGVISSVKDRLTQQIATMDDQIASMQARLALQRATLQREFTQADAAMSRLNSQSGSLANLASGLRSF